MNDLHLYEQLEHTIEFRKKLWDSESRMIFDSRMKFLIDRDWPELQEALLDVVENKKKEIKELSEFLEDKKDKKVVIFGAGQDGKIARKILADLKIDVCCFCDNDRNLWGKCVCGLKILSPVEAVAQVKDYVIIIASGNYAGQMYVQLRSLNVPYQNIYCPRFGKLVAECGKQYFDFEEFMPQENELFVDAGGYDGCTTIDFIQWAAKGYDKIFLFEPDKGSFEVCKENLKKYERVFCRNQGTWSGKDQLSFVENTTASRIMDEGREKIDVIDIDTVLNGEKPTFIKMDVEGAELRTLMGAKQSIQKYFPKLAVSMYHKPEDFIEIPAYLMEIAPDYKFAFRHYTTDRWETVLYAWK